ncbi:acyltransferase [Saccharicrinis sp. FJH62]|uniref:acyltransferase n=1 Tax=Saccharicrinis sp. FJH62 TaxID=3344657 RepID=UPI0035D3DC80
MKHIIIYFYRAFRRIRFKILTPVFNFYSKLLLVLNGVSYGKGILIKGPIKVTVTRKGSLKIGNSLKLNSGNNYNIIGRQQKCIFWIDGELSIGDNVGMSGVAIICKESILIGNNVKIGENTVVYDTDFHSLDPGIRSSKDDKTSAKKSPVTISDNVFIGAHSTILKGVSIGRNSIVGACSVVTKSIPENEIWAGNPAKLIKKISGGPN